MNLNLQLPIDTSLLTHHRLDVEIARGNFAGISLISKGESMWKL